MPESAVVVQAGPLQQDLTRLFMAAGTPQDIASVVAAALVESERQGVESHGVMRAAQYVEQIAAGWIVPAARPELLRAHGGSAVLSARRGFGIFALDKALELAIEKARTGAVAAVGLVECTHTGQLGLFVARAARAGLLAIIIGGGNSGAGRSVAPHGGLARVMATNPYALGLPGGEFGPVVVDIATSATAEGKLRVYRDAAKPLPPGWIVDSQGNPSTDANDFYAGGMLLPIAGHKGYGLALVAELIGRAMLGAVHELNWFIIAVDIAAFRDPATYDQDVASFLSEIKHVTPAPGFAEVLIPGEPEERTARERGDAIPVAVGTIARLRETASRLSIELEL